MESQQTVSFGWGDFPLIESPPDINHCINNRLEDDGGQSHKTIYKRKYLPVIQTGGSTITIEPSAKLIAFGWADFPCVDYSDDSFLTTFPTLSSDFLHLFERPDLVELNNTSDESSDEEGKLYVPYAAKKRVSCPYRPQKIVFSKRMEIREYALTIGDHPYTPRFGLTLDWEPISTSTVALPDEYARYNSRPRRLSERERRERLGFGAEMVDPYYAL
ncbi:hypothetical protein FisN_6Lh176 [Fistulifera solaris]|uniref:Uncharacterized protein n=1 Tax=Fistulifera solaris TaxID=1519565 RepID=A0A1Z5J620_FISSO|nr:hypothetical protein FisN_6Lh176 [Fistulifera solaris]|eukprot:GAX09447.1 hypothetical protein FisN_6Lh176 [Fistulifera solaris]